MSGIIPEHKSISQWLQLVSDAQVLIPEFQRDFVWKKDRIEKLLNAILDDRPIGCLMLQKINQADEYLPFDPRPLEGAKTKSDKPIEFLIIDGQQRISALWHVLVRNNINRTYLIPYSKDKNEKIFIISVNSSYKWVSDPKKCLSKGFVPMKLLRYKVGSEEYNNNVKVWIRSAFADDSRQDETVQLQDFQDWIEIQINKIRNYNIPHLTLSESTTDSQAIETFVNLNTSSVNLKQFDIVVAEALLKQNTKLRKLRDQTEKEVVDLDQYIDRPTIGDLLLKVACLRTGFVPVEGSYKKNEVLEDLKINSDEIIKGVKWVVKLLRKDKIWDSRRLPSVIPLRVLPALYKLMPKEPGKQAAMEKTARAYLWRAFLTDRYKSTAATRLREDYSELCKVIESGNELKQVPIWKCELPLMEEIKCASWPTSSAFPKSLLAISLRRSAKDIGTGEEIREDSIKDREYHHIFPKNYLKQYAPDADPNLVMNCMLISGRTNREAHDKNPMEYLQSVASKAYAGSIIEKSDLKSWLSTHLVEFDSLIVGTKSVTACYNEFLHARAKLVLQDITYLADGSDP